MTNTTTLQSRTLPDSSQPYVLERGQGDHVHFLNHLATRKVTSGDSSSMTAVEFHAPRGFGPPLHCHNSEDEIMILWDGEIAFRSGENESIAGSGATVHLPHGVPHTFQVLSDMARFTTITASDAGVPVFDRMVAALGKPTEQPVLPTPVEIDPGEVAAACGAHGIEVLGPPPAPLD